MSNGVRNKSEIKKVDLWCILPEKVDVEVQIFFVSKEFLISFPQNSVVKTHTTDL